MKKVLLLASLFVVTTAQAQQHTFKLSDTYHFNKNGVFKSHTVKSDTGTINISSKEIIVLEALKMPQTYLIVKQKR